VLQPIILKSPNIYNVYFLTRLVIEPQDVADPGHNGLILSSAVRLIDQQAVF
jgi:hypothetical protein